ncbi:MAG: DNA topoisomerase I, partial [Chitinophagia bacterium]|nr:DNA topoisomerase I [Chitinophagia bacterium]
KGKGRFGPFIKWNDLFINVPRAYNFEQLSEKDIAELISKKQEKESNRFIKQFSAEKISIENGRWGPFIRYQKKMLKLPKKASGEKYLPEELAQLTIEEVKSMIEAQVPGAFSKKSGAKKTTAPKKSATKKAPVKKAAKKVATKKATTKKK